MLRIDLLAGCLSMVLAAAYGGTVQKPFIECDREELLRAVPDLAGLQFDTNQDNLDGLLRDAGTNLDSMFARLVDLSAAEDVNEMRFEEAVAGTHRREEFRYGVKVLPAGGPTRFNEFRADASTGAAVQSPALIDFLVSERFLHSLNYLLPEYQAQWRFRYAGRLTSGSQDYFIVVFAQRPDGLQGIVWIDATSKRIVRLRTDLAGPSDDFPLASLTTDLSLIPVNFKSIGTVFWLPARVTVHARFAGGELHSVHRFSDYQTEREHSAGLQAATAPRGEDAYELVARGIALIEQGKPGGAIDVLREAVRLNPEMPASYYNLGNALRATGDMAGAEGELREAAKLVPDSGVVHNLLGVVLSKRGNVPGSVDEFRRSAQIQPKQPIAHFNLAQALEKSGDRTAALEEYKTASDLAPDNAIFKTRYQQMELAAKAGSAPETTIKVDVRQVLVPVIVTDKEGHHVTGLNQADFQVFEDGVEQKISAFSVEDAGRTGEPAAVRGAGPASEPAPSQAAPEPPPASKPTPIRRTYAICVDSLHSAFGNMVAVRQALVKLFHSEQPGDSQYVVLAVGTSTQVVQNITTDPEKALQAIESKDFQKVFLASRKTSSADDLLDFRRQLDRIRAACDAGQPECQLKSMLPSRANEIASAERVYNMSFLTQFQSVVQQLSRARDRRTIVLISDGFELVPGKEAFELLVAYFPEMRSNGLRTTERMPDLDPILRLAANSNIPVYTIDSRGLYTQSFFDASNPGGVSRMMPALLSIMSTADSDAGATLSEIAAATGGTAFQNSNDLLMGMKRAFADGRQYYLLAYVPSNSNQDGKFRSISVRLRDHKVVVQAKRGYWAVAN